MSNILYPKRLALWGILLALGAALSQCLDPYEPDAVANPPRILVVEGILGDRLSYVNLAYTIPLASTDSSLSEVQGARVTIRNSSGNFSVAMEEQRPGRFSTAVPLSANDSYMVTISTADNEEYVSELTPLLASPPIDSVAWSANNRGIEVTVNTHDPQNNTRYYRWEYEETWQYRSNFLSLYKYENGEVVPREGREEAINLCWSSEKSSRILVGSSAQLAEDVIADFPVVFYTYEGAFKISMKYSILVRQYALSKEAYEFWEILKRNSEELGTFFDPQPSQMPTNIRCTTSPELPVVGFLSGSTVSEQRIFIRNADFDFILPPNLAGGCSVDTVGFSPEEMEQNYEVLKKIPVIEVINMFGNVIGYEVANDYCVDCRLRGGTNVAPDFWD